MNPGSKISTKIIKRMVLFSSFLTLIFTSAQLYSSYRGDLRSISGFLDQIEDVYLESITSAIWVFDQVQLRLLLEGMLHNRNMRSIVIVKDGKKLAAVGEQGAGGNVVTREYPVRKLYNGKSIHLGTLRVTADLDEVYARLLDSVWMILVSNGIKTFAVSFFIFFLLRSLITRHLVAMAGYARAFDLESSQPIQLERPNTRQGVGDELDELVGAFNQMRRNLRQKHGEVYEKESLLRSVVDTVPHWILVKNPEGRILLANKAFADDFGKSSAEIEGRLAGELDMVPKDTRKMWAETDRQVIESGEKLQLAEYIVQLPDGSTRVGNLHKNPLLDEAGNTIGVVGVSEDITGRVAAEGDLRANRRLLRTIIDTLPVGIFVKDTDLRYTLVNRNLAQLSGEHPRQFLGRRSSELSFGTPAESRLMEEADQRILDTGELQETPEHTLTLPDGQVGIRRTLKAPLLNEAGEIIGIVGVREDITDKVNIEKSQQHSRQLLETVLNSIPQWLSAKDAEGRYLMVNRAMAEAFQKAQEDFIGLYPTDVITLPEDVGKLWAESDQWVLKYGEQFGISDQHVLLPDGREEIGRLYKMPLRAEDGQIYGVVAITDNYTELYETERAMRESEERLRSFMESATEGITLYDSQLNYVDMNQVQLERYGLVKEEIIGKNIIEVIPGIKGQDRHERYLNVIRNGKPDTIQNVVTLPYLGERHLEIRAFPVGSGMGVISTDTTERIRAEEDLRLSERGLAQAQQLAQLGSWEWDIGTGELKWSDEIYRIFGLEPKVFRPSFDAFVERVHPEDREALQKAVKEAVEGKAPYIFEHRIVLANGDERIVQEQGEVFHDGQEKPLRMVGIVHDITERKRVDIMKNEFISVVSHELRTPLTSIRGSLGLMLGGVGGSFSDKAHGLLTIANSNAERLVRLINDILDIEKIESGGLFLKMERLDLTELVRRAIRENESYAGDSGVIIRLAEAPTQTMVMGDSDSLLQVMANLISNALKYSKNDGEVRISIKYLEDQTRVEVQDDGPGIPPEFLEKIFDKFSQADSSDTRRAGGSGLGLSISRAIVEGHGGTIGAENMPEEGAVISFVLPSWKDKQQGVNDHNQISSDSFIQ